MCRDEVKLPRGLGMTVPGSVVCSKRVVADCVIVVAQLLDSLRDNCPEPNLVFAKVLSM
jgi:hypothetical protein